MVILVRFVEHKEEQHIYSVRLFNEIIIVKTNGHLKIKVSFEDESQGKHACKTPPVSTPIYTSPYQTSYAKY